MSSVGASLICGPCRWGFQHGLLLAARAFESPRRSRSSAPVQPAELIAYLLIAVLVIGLLIVIPKFHARWQRAKLRSPRRLFQQLCQQHQLPPDAVRLLEELAAVRRLSHPALVFVDASLYRRAGLTRSLVQRQDRLHALRDKLFAAPSCLASTGRLE